MINWSNNQETLIKQSGPIVQGLLAENRDRGDRIVALGYVFEFGRGQLEFDLCANTSKSLEQKRKSLHEGDPDESDDGARWNSGDFDYPAGVSAGFGGWGAKWWEELTRLDRLAEGDEDDRQVVYEGIVEICCQALADLARRGVIENWQQLDFNVADLLDEIHVIKERDNYIRHLIQNTA